MQPQLLWIELSDWSVARIVNGDTVEFLKPGTLTVTLHFNHVNQNVERSVTVNIKDNQTPQPGLNYGDIDGDGKISAYDASLTLSEYAALSAGRASTLTAEQRILADVDGDGKIGANDAGLILTFYSYLAGNGSEANIRDWLSKL